MTSDLYLIAHKVRGEPAFDIAAQMSCPHCIDEGPIGCHECDGMGYWWIIPTSGHRAYPFWHKSLNEAMFGLDVVTLSYENLSWQDISDVPTMPLSLRDHYTTKAEAAFSLTKALGLDKPATPVAPILRRL